MCITPSSRKRDDQAVDVVRRERLGGRVQHRPARLVAWRVTGGDRELAPAAVQGRLHGAGRGSDHRGDVGERVVEHVLEDDGGAFLRRQHGHHLLDGVAHLGGSVAGAAAGRSRSPHGSRSGASRLVDVGVGRDPDQPGLGVVGCRSGSPPPGRSRVPASPGRGPRRPRRSGQPAAVARTAPGRCSSTATRKSRAGLAAASQRGRRPARGARRGLFVGRHTGSDPLGSPCTTDEVAAKDTDG